MSFIMNYLTKIRFGPGSITDIQEDITALGMRSPLIITDKGLVSLGLIDQVLRDSRLGRDIPIFDGTPENPTEDAVEEALAILKSSGCDGIIAVGGGSSIDLAKGVCLLATHDAPLRQYALIEGGAGKITAGTLPLIAVPTTAGTGSEVGRGALITMRDKRKLGLVSPHLIPSVALCDPNLTLSLPPFLTAATGMDAIAHCVETFISPRDNPVAEAIALDGLGRASRNIRTAVKDGANIEARSEMMMAALQGALSFQKGLGAVHSLSHALGGFHELKLHHGTLNALLLPAVLRFNHATCKEKYKAIRQAMGLKANADVSAAFAQINKDLGLPNNLQEMGVTYEILDSAATWGLEDHSTATNPRQLTQADLKNLLEKTME